MLIKNGFETLLKLIPPIFQLVFWPVFGMRRAKTELFSNSTIVPFPISDPLIVALMVPVNIGEIFKQVESNTAHQTNLDKSPVVDEILISTNK